MSEMGNLYFMALPNGEQQAGRDALFRDKSSRGLSPLSDDSTGASDEWEMIKDLFGYDAEGETTLCVIVLLTYFLQTKQTLGGTSGGSSENDPSTSE